MSELYTEKLLAAAASLPPARHLERADAVTAVRTSRVCGSVVELDLAFEGGVVVDVAVRAKACALGQAAAGLFAPLLPGMTPGDIRRARDEMRRMLNENGTPPADPRLAPLAPLAAIRDYPQRHASTMLVFDAAADCAERIDGGH
ncbi:MAG: iron-sulfur cluster assembly scaffold protein [Alphaproteobacteria bacterium]|nr:iron-sulfur cluster assembly scaffold protein [Alphaproteobacteria bacterium]